MKPIHVTSGGKAVTLANESQRNEFINDAISEEIKAGAPSLEVAYANAEKRFPAVFATMKHPSIKMPHRQRERTFANSAPAPAFTDNLKGLFGLPQTADQPACEAAWTANGGQAMSFHYPRIFAAMVSHLQKSRGLEPAAADKQARLEFPLLARMSDSIAQVHPGIKA